MHVDCLEPIGPLDEDTELCLPAIREEDWTPTETLHREAFPPTSLRAAVLGYLVAGLLVAGALVASSAVLGIALWLA